MPTERLQVTFRRTLTEFDEDVIVCTTHYQSDTQGLLTPSIRGFVEQHWQEWWGFYGQQCPPLVALHEFRWYDQRVWPERSPLIQFNDTVDIPGTSVTTVLPPQLAVSHTLQTVDRRRWGRFYAPGVASGALEAGNGRLANAAVDTFRDLLLNLAQQCKGNGAQLVTWSPKGATKPPLFGAGSTALVTGVRVDDIVDVVRSRRWQDKPYRATGVIS